MRANFVITAILVLFATNAFSQKSAIKTNIPYIATATPNLALELGLAKRITLDISYGINPFSFEDNKKWSHWLTQAELRYWPCERFYGHFFGLHVGAAEYNLSRLKIPTVADSQDFRYEGWAAMGGLSYGYSWILGGRWNMEATLGIGLVYTDYEKFECHECGIGLSEGNKVSVAPTRAGISIIYMLK